MVDAKDAPLRTAADDLLDLVRKKGKIELDEATKDLKIPGRSVQALVDFLVEEKVLGIEYKFTTPYIYLNDEERQVGKRSSQSSSLLSKEEFYRKAQEKGASEQQCDALWQKYLKENQPAIKAELVRKAMERGASRQQAEQLWKKYLAYL